MSPTPHPPPQQPLLRHDPHHRQVYESDYSHNTCCACPNSLCSPVASFLSSFHRCCACLCTLGSCLGSGLIIVIGPFLALTASSLITAVTVAYFIHIYPLLLSFHHLSQFTSYAVTLFGVYLLFMILFHYFSCMFTPPGLPPESSTWSEEQRAWLAQDPERLNGQEFRYCKKCDRIKPMRTHHCHICNKCVLKMDHHWSIH